MSSATRGPPSSCSTSARRRRKRRRRPGFSSSRGTAPTTRTCAPPASGEDLRFEEIEVTTESGRGGKSIRELDIRRQTGALIVALRKRDGTFDTTPTPEAVLDVGDVLIAAGTEEELRALEGIFAPQRAIAP